MVCGRLKSGDYMDLIRKALEIAIKAHKGVVDKGGADYIFHPITVALKCKTDDEKVVALLHDVVEDTPMTFNDLRKEGFPEYIIEALNAITRRKPQEQNGDGRWEYIKRCKANPIARVVKIADLEHNSDLSRIPNPTEKFKKRVIEEYPAEIEFLKS